MSNDGYWFADPLPFISTPTIGALHGQQSAVHCLSSKCVRSFPQNSLVFALLHAFCFCSFCSSVWINLSYDGFQGQAGPRQVDVSRLDKKLKCATPGMDWVSGCQGPLLAILVIATSSTWLSIISSGNLVKSGNMWKHVSQAQSLLSRACVVKGFSNKFCGQKWVL